MKKGTTMNEKDLIEIEYSTEIVGIRSQRIRYKAEVTHYGLGDYKTLSSDNNYILENKVERHIENLKERWDKIVIKQNIVRTKEELQKESEFRSHDGGFEKRFHPIADKSC